MKQRKILDVVLECIDKGIDSKPVLDKLRKNNLLFETKAKNSNFCGEDFQHGSKKNEISDSQWEKFEREHMQRRYGGSY